MLTATVLRELRTDPGQHPQRTAWLSAASGLVCIGGQAYVIADDEHHLGHVTVACPGTLEADDPVQLMRLFEGEPPLDRKERKRSKPDLESLALLPAFSFHPHGALLTLGSGSKPSRCRGKLLALDAQQEPSGSVVSLDLSEWYRTLQVHFADLNIEGAFVADGVFRLIQRGNKGSESACLVYSWDEVAAWLQQPSRGAPRVESLSPLDFGEFGGVPICPTDATSLPHGGWVFSAVAENTDDSYRDGACLASFVGVMDVDNQLIWLERLRGNPKVEGVALVMSRSAESSELLLVTDPDDPSQPSQLLRLSIPATRLLP